MDATIRKRVSIGMDACDAQTRTSFVSVPGANPDIVSTKLRHSIEYSASFNLIKYGILSARSFPRRRFPFFFYYPYHRPPVRYIHVRGRARAKGGGGGDRGHCFGDRMRSTGKKERGGEMEEF
jgi:hypothetical protein